MLEVGGHVQAELAHLLYAASEAVVPAIDPLRTITYAQSDIGPGGNRSACYSNASLIGYGHRNVIDRHHKIVVDRLLSGKLEAKGHGLGVAAGVVKSKRSRESHLVEAVPKQSFLPIFKVQTHVSIGAVQGKGNV